MSRKILSIEEELSIKLFERTHHRVSLTNAGQEFYYQISTMLKSYDTAVTQAQNMDKGVRDSVQIGVGVYEHALLRPVIQDFIHQHPISKLNCVQFKYHELIESFDHGNMDLIITSDQFLQTIDQEDLELILVHDYPWCLVLDQNNPLARKEVVDMADLHTQNIITMNQGSISVIRSLFRPWFPLTSIDYVNSWETKLTLVNAGDGILTHCNAGQLATSQYGTALGPILLGQERGIPFRVFADETRPLLQGARLTAWELQRAGVDVTLICDNMASMVMKQGLVQACFVGCDRIAANGDAANKIGTSGVAVLAKHYGIPFYVLGPSSTIDLDCPTGADIPIEERPGQEIGSLWYREPMAPAGVKFYNPAFDVTDHTLITGIVTETGVCYPPFTDALRRMKEENA